MGLPVRMTVTPPLDSSKCPRCKDTRPEGSQNEVYCDACFEYFAKWLNGDEEALDYKPRYDGVYCDDDDDQVTIDPDSLLHSD